MMQSFVQNYGSDAVDASSLLMVLTKFAGPTDPRILQTVDRIQQELASDSLVFRYDPTKAAHDGIGTSQLPHVSATRGLCLCSTAILHTVAGVQLWLHRMTHQGVLTRRPCSSSLAE